jgi:hypothetical protein
MNAIGPDRKFMGGNEPNLADLVRFYALLRDKQSLFQALYGAINSFIGCRAFAEMRENTKIGDWFDRTQQAVLAHSGSRELAKSLAVRQKSVKH